MKKQYLFVGLSLLLSSSLSFGQKTKENYNFGQAKLEMIDREGGRALPTQHTEDDRALVTLWSEDFTGSTGLTTANGTWVVEGAEGSYWTIGNDTHPLSSFNWTHALDGEHLTWDSYNPNDSEASFASTAVNGAIVSPTMDLSASTNGAFLEFDVETMYCCNYSEFPWFIYVSTDGGTSWSSAIALDFGVDRNVPTEDIAHPMTYSVDISAYLDATPANNNNVKIKFSWEAANADGNGQYNTHYFWLMDDMTVYEIPQYEVIHQRLWLEDIVNGYEYTDIALSQAQTLTVQSKVKNLGSNTPTNLASEVTVYDASNAVVATETGGALSTPPFVQGVVDTLTFATSIDLSTFTTGTYTVRVVTTYDENASDEVPTNDTLWRTFNITDNILSHVDYDQPTGRNYSSTTSTTMTGADFPIYSDVVVHGVNFYLRDGSTTYPSSTGIDIEINIYQDNGSTIDFVEGPFTYTLDASMLDQWNTFNFYQSQEGYSNPLTLTAGNYYVPVMTVYAGDYVWYQSNSIDEDNSGLFYHSDNDSWYLTGDEPWVALNFDESLNTNDIDNVEGISVSQNYPNPFNGNTVISYNLNESTNVSVEVLDITGKVVKTITPGTQGAGEHTLTIDGSNLAEGTYFYTFTAGTYKVTKRMVVTK